MRSDRIQLFAVPSLMTSLLLASSGVMHGQDVRATVNGHVEDASKAAVPSATVIAKNVQTGVTTTVKAAEDGNYTLPFLQPGTYTFSADAQGFKTAVRSDVTLHVGDRITVDLTLSVGEVSEVVNVSGAAPLLDEGSATRSGLVDNVRVTELPLNGRNPFQLANLVPGVTFNGNPSFTRPFDNGDNANFSINGGLRQSNAFLIDGAPDDAISDTAGDRSHANVNVAYIPTVDATEEFKIVNNFYDAQYGRTGGGIFNVSTKQGTNVYHGTGYEFLRRYQLDANSISNKVSGIPRYAVDPVTKANLGGHTLDQYGFALTGPLSIPHLYNAKDKTFFLFAFENYHEASPSPTLTSTITAAERTGDFSAAGEPTIYDPFTTRLDANGVCCTRDPFPGNRIPAARLAPSAGYKIAQAFPAPNVGTAALLASNYNTGVNLSEDRFRNWIGRVDQNFGQRERLYVRYAHARRNQVDNGAYNITGPLLDAQDPLARVNDTAVVDSLTSFNNRITMDLRFSFTRYNETVDRSRVNGYDDTQLGFSQTFSSSRFVPVPPRISLGSTTSIPDVGTRNPRFGISNILGFQPSVQIVTGKHSFHIGADLRDFDYNTGGGSFVYGGGAFAFTPAFTQQNPLATTNSTQGSSVASLLLGTPAASNNSITSIIQYTPRLGYRWRYYATYLQDDFKLSQRFTINAGIRYDIEGSPHEIANRQNRGFAFTTPSNLAAAARSAGAICPACQGLTGGLLFAGAGGQSEDAFNTQFTHVQPRIGVVFRAFNETIFRGGYGMFYLPEAAFGAAQGFAQDTAYVPNNITGGTTVDLYRPRGNNPLAPPINDPFPTLLQPTGSSLGLATFEGQNIIFNNVNRKVPRAHQWSFGMEQQLPYNVKVDLSYVGSRTVDINTNDNQAGGARNLNVLSNAQIAQAQTAATAARVTAATYVGQSVQNPFAGLLPGTNLNGTTVARQQLLYPYPQFLGVTYGQESVGKLWYDSAQLSIEKRYSHGLTILGSYTWSKTLEALSFLNNQDAAPFKNISASDRPQRLVLSAVYELPFGRGHRLGANASRPVELLIGGWQLNYIETIQSGAPTALNGGANLLRDPRVGVNKSYDQYFNTCVQLAPTFNPATGAYLPAGTQQPNSTHNGFTTGCANPAWQQVNSANLELRSAPFYSGYIRNPNAPLADISFAKRFNITDRYNAQFRFEAFNATNTAIRNGANTTPTSNQFGYINVSQSNIPRQVQLGFKFNF